MWYISYRHHPTSATEPMGPWDARVSGDDRLTPLEDVEWGTPTHRRARYRWRHRLLAGWLTLLPQQAATACCVFSVSYAEVEWGCARRCGGLRAWLVTCTETVAVELLGFCTLAAVIVFIIEPAEESFRILECYYFRTALVYRWKHSANVRLYVVWNRCVCC
jgi:hypothetical protein